jgi:hypothetical protein
VADPKRKAVRMERNENLDRLLQLGQQMSNLCFNLSQHSVIPETYRMQMHEAYTRWDEADKRIRPARKAKAKRKKAPRG